MLNKDKVTLMTQLAIKEKEEGETLKLSKYYKSDYVRFNVIKTVLFVSFAYILLVLLMGMYNIEELVDNAMFLDYTKVLLKIGGGYVVLLIGFSIFGFIFYSRKYENSKKSIIEYYKKLEELTKFYKDETKKS